MVDNLLCWAQELAFLGFENRANSRETLRLG